ncbi:5-(carboxyamino)imidazole ribonucleotide synthase [Arthrobacter agilis]|uniref:5-(carboxyamino)imidazole ribonucleotide synthase n=1 Tax=Arthrobacter agilis TaxID=37921 RepID=UPI000B359812|nr:5-(carboxyamino)imidazole ribonucleotide synthase [Arthrobacter agilis]OUM40521.1 5-(carboxyamino)imidazole ribonucleotide synthase [Arthrobacter agilis]PPB45135.1 5-(carboxyamino)imidazole ribonucleotide synthase [Arthrobacter agilis]TPV27835.1 5-(carboxyamino)imidazole ribonucleotide synthase [Arthrobacter agilis]VDR31503.1 N5-carboxyaminoimidazole ribonucleotide synthase [Arthrobacter agilis]
MVTFPVIGVIGGGQLARMMAGPAIELGFELRVLAEGPDVSAVAAVAHAEVGDYRDRATLRAFAAGVDVVTFDHEHVPGGLLEELEREGVAVHPSPAALLHAQDKLVMRRAVEALGLPNPAWRAVTGTDDVAAFAKDTGWPVVLKTPRGGYDGKGVLVLRNPAALADAESWFTGGELLVEEFVPFSRELSVLVARRPSGEAAAWPVVESIQVDSVCDEVIAPAPELAPDIAAAVTKAALKLADQLGVTGVMAVELFEVPGSAAGYLVNELAMRPHNSGHWTMDGSLTGQFEQHLRAVLDLPLGSTAPVARYAVMKNILGGANADLFGAYPGALSSGPSAKVHVYGKDVRPGRKIGHVNSIAIGDESLETVRTRATRVAVLLRDGTVPPSTDQDRPKGSQ